MFRVPREGKPDVRERPEARSESAPERHQPERGHPAEAPETRHAAPGKLGRNPEHIKAETKEPLDDHCPDRLLDREAVSPPRAWGTFRWTHDSGSRVLSTVSIHAPTRGATYG